MCLAPPALAGGFFTTVLPGKPRRAALGVKSKGRNRIHLKGWKFEDCGNSLVVQWLGLHTLTAEGLGSISGQASKFPQVAQCGKKEKKLEYLKQDRVQCEEWV